MGVPMLGIGTYNLLVLRQIKLEQFQCWQITVFQMLIEMRVSVLLTVFASLFKRSAIAKQRARLANIIVGSLPTGKEFIAKRMMLSKWIMTESTPKNNEPCYCRYQRSTLIRQTSDAQALKLVAKCLDILTGELASREGVLIKTSAMKSCAPFLPLLAFEKQLAQCRE